MFAEPAPAPDYAAPAADLPPVVVTATRADRRLDDLPMAAGLAGRDRVARSRGVALDDLLGGAPGFGFERRSEGADDVKIVARGFGARAAFGARDVLVLVEGIPVTDLDGQARLEALEPDAVDRIETLRGPAAGLYGGGALGGAVNVLLKRGSDSAPRVRVARTEGSLGLERTQVAVSSAGAIADGFLSVSQTHARGWRHHAASSGVRFTGGATLRPDDDTAVRVVALGNSVDLLRPGPISASLAELNPRLHRAANAANRWSRHEDRLKLGATVDRRLTDAVTAAVMAHGDARWLEQPIFQWARSQKTSGGADARVRWSYDALGARLATTAGGAAGWHKQDEQDYRNVTGYRGPLTADEESAIRSRAGYLQQEVDPLPGITFLGHLRLDRLTVRLSDRFTSDGDQSGGRAWTEPGHALGLRARPLDAVTLFANVASGWSVPSLTELRQPVSGTRFDLDPARSASVEVGVRAEPWRGARIELVAYHARVTGEIARQTIGTTPYYRNIDRSIHRGLETGFGQTLPLGLAVDGALTVSDARFRDDPVFGTNRLPGVPPAEAHLGLRWARDAGPWAGVTGRWRRRTFADDANTVAAGTFRTLSIALGWASAWCDLTAGCDNLTDARYTGSLAVNDAAGNFFEPADPRTFWITLGVKWP